MALKPQDLGLGKDGWKAPGAARWPQLCSTQGQYKYFAARAPASECAAPHLLWQRGRRGIKASSPSHLEALKST